MLEGVGAGPGQGVANIDDQGIGDRLMRDRYSTDEADGASRLFVILAIVTFAFLAGWHLASDEAPATRLKGVAGVAPLPEPSEAGHAAMPTSPPVSIPRSRKDSTSQRYVGVYECSENGQRIVSDRPCGPGATARILAVEPPNAPPPSVPTFRSPMPGSSTSVRSTSGTGSGVATASAGNEAACAAVDREIDALNARMRQGYGSQTGKVYRARWHALKERRYDLGCGR